jgi:1-acyl-sn-glycerol-3-phosphate acyltransferase
MRLRGGITLAITLLGLLVLDLIQRLVIAPWVRLRPSRREAVLGRWIHVITWFLTTTPRRIGGAQIPEPPNIPNEPGVLILMNHQSLFDVPIIVDTVDPGYLRIVTRERYASWVPVISHLVRLYEYPVVNPLAKAGTLRSMVKKLIHSARNAEVPLALFPEGTRTKDGEIGPMKTKGLGLVLRARPWKVYVLVIDGFWQMAKLKDLVGGMSGIRGRIELAGVLEWSDPKGDPEPFAEEVRALMVERLKEMRGGVVAV